jgi:hypothetical protein
MYWFAGIRLLNSVSCHIIVADMPKRYHSGRFVKRFITLLLLLAAAGTAFFFGWAQFNVPAGYFGVLRSKTHGIDSEVIREGKLRWYWYMLIPRNAAIAVFSVNEKTIALDFSGALPSGDTYAALAGVKADFSWNCPVSLSFRLKPESLPAISEREILLDQADLDGYLSRLSAEIEDHACALLWTYSGNESILKEAQETGTIKALERELASAFPDIEMVGLTVKALRYPDFVLYSEIRQLYRDYIAAQRAAIRDDIVLIAAENIRNRRRLDELANVGEIISKYPVLLQYLALEKGQPLTGAGLSAGGSGN